MAKGSVTIMEKNKNPQTETLNEEQLEEVAGGNFQGNCYFEPEIPLDYEHNKYMGVRVKCKSNCLAKTSPCKCHGTEDCIHKYHRVEQFSENIWLPSPINERNHSGERKAIKNLFI